MRSDQVASVIINADDCRVRAEVRLSVTDSGSNVKIAVNVSEWQYL